MMNAIKKHIKQEKQHMWYCRSLQNIIIAESNYGKKEVMKMKKMVPL